MSISRTPLDPTSYVCDTTAVRYFAITGRFDLLAEVLDGTVRVPRQVYDDEDQVDLPGSLVSEIGEAERFFGSRRSKNPKASECWSMLRMLRVYQGIEIVDLVEPDEVATYGMFRSPGFARDHRLAGPLGRGEAAVMAVAEHRGWAAVIDEAPARRILGERRPDLVVVTVPDLLRRAVAHGSCTQGEAQSVYDDMQDCGYKGPPTL